MFERGWYKRRLPLIQQALSLASSPSPPAAPKPLVIVPPAAVIRSALAVLGKLPNPHQAIAVGGGIIRCLAVCPIAAPHNGAVIIGRPATNPIPAALPPRVVFVRRAEPQASGAVLLTRLVARAPQGLLRPLISVSGLIQKSGAVILTRPLKPAPPSVAGGVLPPLVFARGYGRGATVVLVPLPLASAPPCAPGWGIPLSFGTLEVSAILAGVDCSMEFQFMSNTEPITLYRKLSDGTFDGGTAVTNALRLEMFKTQPIGSTGAKVVTNQDWYVWTCQTGQPPVKDGDVIQDGIGARWVVKLTHQQAWGARFLCETVLAK